MEHSNMKQSPVLKRKSKRKIEFAPVVESGQHFTDRENGHQMVTSNQDEAMFKDFNRQASIFLRSMHPQPMHFIAPQPPQTQANMGGYPQGIFPTPNYPNFYPPQQSFKTE
jgi:hypothetical protein